MLGYLVALNVMFCTPGGLTHDGATGCVGAGAGAGGVSMGRSGVGSGTGTGVGATGAGVVGVLGGLGRTGGAVEHGHGRLSQ